MKRLPLSLLALGALGLVFIPESASAVPLAASATLTGPEAQVEPVHWRRYRHCHRINRRTVMWHGPGERRRVYIRGGRCPWERRYYRYHPGYYGPGLHFQFRFGDDDRHFRKGRDRDRKHYKRDYDRGKDGRRGGDRKRKHHGD